MLYRRSNFSLILLPLPALLLLPAWAGLSAEQLLCQWVSTERQQRTKRLNETSMLLGSICRRLSFEQEAKCSSAAPARERQLLRPSSLSSPRLSRIIRGGGGGRQAGTGRSLCLIHNFHTGEPRCLDVYFQSFLCKSMKAPIAKLRKLHR